MILHSLFIHDTGTTCTVSMILSLSYQTVRYGLVCKNWFHVVLCRIVTYVPHVKLAKIFVILSKSVLSFFLNLCVFSDYFYHPYIRSTVLRQICGVSDKRVLSSETCASAFRNAPKFVLIISDYFWLFLMISNDFSLFLILSNYFQNVFSRGTYDTYIMTWMNRFHMDTNIIPTDQ